MTRQEPRPTSIRTLVSYLTRHPQTIVVNYGFDNYRADPVVARRKFLERVDSYLLFRGPDERDKRLLISGTHYLLNYFDGWFTVSTPRTQFQRRILYFYRPDHEETIDPIPEVLKLAYLGCELPPDFIEHVNSPLSESELRAAIVDGRISPEFVPQHARDPVSVV